MLSNKSEKKKKEKKPRVLIDVSSFPQDEKGRAIVPDDFFDDHVKELPDGTHNESGTKYAHFGGVLKALGADPERDYEIRKAGGVALQAKLKERRTLAESLEIALRQKASKDLVSALGLPEGATNQDAITAAIINQAGTGNTKAYTALRDTIGEMPVSKQQIQADVMTAADRALLEKIGERMNENR